jgi:CPA2 family monovalent cation:H+ antiporter-2
VLAILIFQDLAVVAMVLVVPMLGGGGGTGAGIAWALGKAVAIIALVVVVARRVMPRVLEAVARTCSQEIFVLTVMAICFGTALLTSLAGVSLSLGAFLAGLLVSESRFSDLAFGEIQPLQILFSATFFVSIGLLLDLRFLAANLPLVLAVVGGVVVVKALAAGLSVRLLGDSLGTAAFAGLITAQVGEFSFVLERTGREMALYPAGMAESGPRTFIAATVILMMATPLLARLGAAIGRRFPGAAGRRAVAAAPEGGAGAAAEVAPQGHVVIAGYGRSGRQLAAELDARGVPYLILTLSPDGAREAERLGRRVLRGNYTRRHELSLAGLDTARLLVVADDELETTRRVVRAVRAMHPELRIVAATRFERDAGPLREAGADRVVADEVSGAARLMEAALEALGAPALRTPEERPGRGRPVRLTARQRANPGCPHAASTGEVTPGAEGCEECLKLGDTWVHLRICMACGHVGCCDESKNKHATAHFHATGHPVIRSFQPGESWAWCYVDETML